MICTMADGHDGLKELQKKILAFRDEREWKQFHNPKDVALSLVLEGGGGGVFLSLRLYFPNSYFVR